MKTDKIIPGRKGNYPGDELDAMRSYNDAIRRAREVNDKRTLDMLTTVLDMEESNLGWEEIQQTLIQILSNQNYRPNHSDSPGM